MYRFSGSSVISIRYGPDGSGKVQIRPRLDKAEGARHGFLIAAFGEGMRKDSIRRVAEADERYLRAIQRQENFGSAADSETMLMFAADVRKARTEFLLTLEAVYRGEDVPLANDGSLAS